MAFGSSQANAQARLGGEMTFTQTGNNLAISVDIAAVGAGYNLGPSTLKFRFDASKYDLADSPADGADYTFDAAFVGGGYSNTVTQPNTDEASINVFIFNPGGGTPVSAAARNLVTLNMTVSSPLVASPDDFTWFTCEHSDSDFSFSVDDCASFVDGSLPVELSAFEVTTSDRSAQLAWTTSSELNNAGFSVEYARTGEDFQEAGYVEGSGTTEEAKNYSFELNEILPGKYQFRLKQIDFDGQFEYSDVVEADVSIPGEYMLDNAYPNPFNPQTTINFAVAEEQEVRFDLYDATGRMVRTLFQGTVDSNEAQTLRVDGSDLTSGVYIGVLVGQTFKASQRLVLIK